MSLLAFRRKINDSDAGEILWKLAEDQMDVWQPRYLEVMSFCNLRWSKWHTTWLEVLRRATFEELLDSWVKVIVDADCVESTDRKALLEFLLTILENPKQHPSKVTQAAKRRLSKFISEIEPVGFEEGPLSLPLPPVTKLTQR